MLKFHDFPGFSWPVRTLKKLEERLSIPNRHMFPCLVSIHRKMLIQRQTSFLNQDWSPSRGSGAIWIILFQKCLPLHSRSLNNICTVVIPGQILARQCSWRSIELSNRLQNPHNSKPSRGDFNNSRTRWPQSEKPLQTSRSCTLLVFR